MILKSAVCTELGEEALVIEACNTKSHANKTH